jgi:hypothetical protein
MGVTPFFSLIKTEPNHRTSAPMILFPCPGVMLRLQSTRSGVPCTGRASSIAVATRSAPPNRGILVKHLSFSSGPMFRENFVVVQKMEKKKTGPGTHEHWSGTQSMYHITEFHPGNFFNATRRTLPTFAKLTYLSVHDSRDGVSEHAASPSPPSSLTHVHRCIGSRNATRQTLPTSAKLTYPSMYDSRDGFSEHATSPSPPSSLTHVHRCIGSRNATRQTLPTFAKLTYPSMYDSRNGAT